VAEGSQLPWVCAALQSAPGSRSRTARTFPEALALVHRMAAGKAQREGLPAGTRLRVKVTRTPMGGLWLDGEPLPPKPVDDWGPPPAGAPCTCRPHPAGAVYGWSPECPQHGESPDPCDCRCACTYDGPAEECHQHGRWFGQEAHAGAAAWAMPAETTGREPCTCDAHGMAYGCPQHGLL